MTRVSEHYGRDQLLASVLDALSGAGLNIDDLHPEDLAPLDEFHIGGRQATREMIRLAAIGREDRVLDVGAGIGGPARTIAAATGCRVCGVDLTPDYCRVATDLTSRVGLDARVEFREADALALPFEAASFDVVWTQHMTMNVADKARLFGELARVLRPGGRLVCYEVLAGARFEAGVHYPVPWADDETISFLESPEAMRRRLEAAGLEIVQWLDRTQAGTAFFQRLMSKGGNRRGLGLHLLVGPDMPVRTGNLLRNLEENRVGVALVLAQRA